MMALQELNESSWHLLYTSSLVEATKKKKGKLFGVELDNETG